MTLSENKLKIDLNQYGLNWNVVKQRLHYHFNDNEIVTPFYGLVREDNGNILGSCSNKYKIRQNADISLLIEQVCNNLNVKVKNAGSYNSGRKVFFQLEFPDLIKIGPDDVKKYMFALSSHDGKNSLALGFSNQVISCGNQFNRFMKNASLKLRHSGSLDEKFKDVELLLSRYFIHEESFYDTLNKFTGIPITNAKDIESLIYWLVNVDEKTIDDISTHKQRQIDDLKYTIGKEMKTKGNSFWGLFNGVTYYANHVKKLPKNVESKESSINIGSSYNLMNNAFDYLEGVDKW